MAFGFLKGSKIKQQYESMHAAFLHDDYLQAEQIGEEILEKNPDHIDTMMLIAQMARNEKHYKKAWERYNKVLHGNGTHSQARLGRAKASYELFEFENALDDFLTLYETSFKTTEYLVALGDTYQKLNLHVIALRYYEKAVQQSSSNIRAHVGLGYQYLIMGQYKRAKEQAEIAKDLYYKHKYEYDTHVVDNIFGLEEQVSLLTKEDETPPKKKSPRKKRTVKKKPQKK